MNTITSSIDKSKESKTILVLAAFTGLFVGLIEGIILFFMQINGWLFWRLANKAIWVETLWISPLFDFLGLIILGFLLVLIAKLFHRIPVVKIALFIFPLIAIFDFLVILLEGRISIIAIFLLSLGAAFQLGLILNKNLKRCYTFARKSIPWMAGLFVMIFISVQGGKWVNEKITENNLAAADPNSPNILVVVVDALRADHLSGYGYSRDTSPNIDRLIQEGTIFSNAIAPSSWTQPSHASLLTGRYTYEHQAEQKPLGDQYVTIGEALQDDGYRTGAISANLFFFTRRQGLGRGFIHFEDNFQTIPDMIANTLYGYLFDWYFLRKALNYEEPIYRKYASDVTDSALSWIQKDSETPFFAFLNYFDVHDPYTPPSPYRTKFSQISNPGGVINSYLERYSPEMTSEQLNGEIDAYDGAISYVDSEINRLLTALQETDQLDNTLVIITSDHGESFGEHGLLQHSNSLYYEQIHVPLVFWWPVKIPADKQIDTPVSITDIPATIISLSRNEKNIIPGNSLSSLIFDQKPQQDWPDPISELAQFSGAAQQNPSTHGEMKSVISPVMQYINHQTFGEELYDLKADPQESVNLSSSPEQQTTIAGFRQYLEKLLGSQNYWK